MRQVWMRTCQECMNRQVGAQPPKDAAAYERWTEAVCKKCRSPALDYGCFVELDD